MKVKSIKEMLKEQELVVGPMVMHVYAPWIAKIYADAGADFVYVENEHVLHNEADLANLILSCRLCGLPVIAKSTYNDRGSIAKLLEAGVTGIQLPMTEEAGQISQFVSYVKFPPLGIRAFAPGIGNSDYEAVDCGAWLKAANDETIVIAHVETIKGVENIGRILEIPMVDIVYIGSVDLSVSIGHPACYEHPDFINAVEKLINSTREYGKTIGMYAVSYEMAIPWIKKGVRFFETAGEVSFIASGVTELMEKFPGHKLSVHTGARHT